MDERGSDLAALVDSKGRVKEFSRGRRLLVHRDFADPSPPYRVVRGEEAATLYRDYCSRVSAQMAKRLNDPETAEGASRVISRMKERGTWIEPPAARSAGQKGDG